MAINTFMAQWTLQKWYIMLYLTLNCLCACIDRLTKYLKRYFKHTDEWFKQVDLDIY